MIVPQKPSSDRPIILCVEDEGDLRTDIVDELTEAGYSVLEAANGGEALDILERCSPDLVLCDISMPGISGYEVLRVQQSRGAERACVPFVFLTALADPRQVVEGKALGADDYLVKPIDYDLLLATVHARLRQVSRVLAAHSARRQEAPRMKSAMEAFGLTPSETRVVQALISGRTLKQIAADFAVSRTTVAYHVRNIFQKTGTNRQAELVALLLRSAGLD